MTKQAAGFWMPCRLTGGELRHAPSREEGEGGPLRAGGLRPRVCGAVREGERWPRRCARLALSRRGQAPLAPRGASGNGRFEELLGGGGGASES